MEPTPEDPAAASAALVKQYADPTAAAFGGPQLEPASIPIPSTLELLNGIPARIEAVYQTSTANQPLELYNGEVTIRQHGHSWNGNGALLLRWLPHAHLWLHFSPILPDKPAPGPKIDHGEAELHGLSTQHPVFVAAAPVIIAGPGSGFGGDFSIGAVVASPVVSGSSLERYRRIRFHLPNFTQHHGSAVRTSGGGVALLRVTLSFDEWCIALDALEDRPLADAPAATLGYLLTHVGSVERNDRKQFSFEDAHEILECATYFLSFCNAAWTAPMLLCGENENGQVVGQHWNTPTVSSQKSRSWVPKAKPVGGEMQLAFTGFCSKWTSSTSTRSTLQRAVAWYVESSAATPETSVILTQAVLEMLGWIALVEDGLRLSEDGWTKIIAADKLRILLGTRQITNAIPDSLKELAGYGRAFNCNDGPGVLTDIRNALVHSDPKKRARLASSPHALPEAKTLGLWYLDLLLLNLCDYRGLYSKRVLTGVWAGQDAEMVPWAGPAEQG
jgi:hypothetical protein